MLVGRNREKELLERKRSANKSEFVAVYGRRRVGKTFMIRTFFDGKFTFRMTGISNASLQNQLANFNDTLREQYPKMEFANANNWFEAFGLIKRVISTSKSTKKVIFIDELPWFDTPHSGFIHALEHFWNSWATERRDILLVVCGSAASWMINKLINNKGGLHNRVTQKIKLEPFTLKECEDFAKHKKIYLDRYQLIQLYMVLGGIPFYWDAIEKGMSATQSINALCFEKNGLLSDEFQRLYHSLFHNAERHEAIIAALAQKSKGLTRDEISKISAIPTGGGLTRLLNELEESGFIRKYTPFGKQYRNSLYQLSDFFSLFHVRFMREKTALDDNHWLNMIDSPKYKTWSGYAFEQVCLAHLPKIKDALGISGIHTETSSWRSVKSENGAQIDLVIDRRDGVINVCEMKFSNVEYNITKNYDAQLRNKISTFQAETQTKKSVFLTVITTHGLLQNLYSGNVAHDLSMDSLF